MGSKKKLRTWVQENRQALRDHVCARLGRNKALSDGDLEEWVLNDEALYLWAQRDGVDI